MAKLFGFIGTSRGVAVDRVRESLDHRPLAFDIVVMLTFAFFYVVGTERLSENVVRRYPAGDGWMEPAVLTTFIALAWSASGVMVGDQWAATWENLRLDTGHLSYREAGLPWIQHHTALFLIGVILVALMFAVRYLEPINLRRRSL